MWRLLWVRIGSRATFRPYTLYLLSIGCSNSMVDQLPFSLFARPSLTHSSVVSWHQSESVLFCCMFTDLRSEIPCKTSKYMYEWWMRIDCLNQRSRHSRRVERRGLSALNGHNITNSLTLPTSSHTQHTRKRAGWRGRDEGKRKKSWVILMQLSWTAKKRRNHAFIARTESSQLASAPRDDLKIKWKIWCERLRAKKSVTKKLRLRKFCALLSLLISMLHIKMNEWH